MEEGGIGPEKRKGEKKKKRGEGGLKGNTLKPWPLNVTLKLR